MHRLVAILAALVMLFAMSATAFAVSPSQAECEAQGGTFTREQGTVTCVIVTEENVGNAPEHSKAQKVKTTDEESSQGTLENDPHFEETSECDGPGNSTAQCP